MKIKIISILITAVFSAYSYATTYQIKHVAIGMVAKKEESKVVESIVFRHINHDTEGWADIVIAKVKDTQFINSEASYRAAAINAGFDSYYSKPTSSRCTGQIYGPTIVPAIDYGCDTTTANLQKYILFKKPDDITNMPTHIVRVFDQNYWQSGNGTWLQTHGIKGIPLEVGVTNLLKAKSQGSSSGVTATLSSGAWMMVADPKTNKR